MIPTQTESLIALLQSRFEAHQHRHPELAWATVRSSLESAPHQLAILQSMESSGGEPDVVVLDPASREIIFVDCSRESPAGRRSLCYDHDAWHARKQAKPVSSAARVAEEMGIELLTESDYLALQRLESFDLKTSSWLLTPPDLRARGGALFGDCRYGRTFIYHNGAESYFGARGFRGLLRVQSVQTA